MTTKNKTSQEVTVADSSSGFIRLSPIPSQAPTAASSQLPTGSMEVVLPKSAIDKAIYCLVARYNKIYMYL